MSERYRTLVRIAAYAAAGLLCTLFFVYETFPVEAVQGRVQRAIEQQAPGLHLSFGDASPWRLSGIDIEDLKLTVDRASGESVTVNLDRARTRLQILPLLAKRYEVSFDVQVGEGHATGEVRVGPSSVGLTLRTSDVDFGHPPLLAKLLGADMGGNLVTDLDVTIDNDPKKTSGHGEIELKRARSGELSVMGFTIPPIDLGNTSVAFEIKDGVMSIKKFEQKSADVEANLSGDLTLRKQVMSSNLNLGVKFKLSDDFLQKNPKFKTILQISGAQRTKNPDGFMSAKLTGVLSNPIPSL